MMTAKMCYLILSSLFNSNAAVLHPWHTSPYAFFSVKKFIWFGFKNQKHYILNDRCGFSWHCHFM